MKKILFVIEQLYSGGAERVTVELANYFCEKQIYEVHLVTYKENLQKEYVLHDNVVRHNIPVSGVKLERFVKRVTKLRSIINDISPICVISLSTTQTSFFLSLANIGTKIPLILSERNDPSRYKNNRLMRLERYFSFLLCQGIVFQTKMAQNFFSKGVQKKSIVICNPINSELPPHHQGERDPIIVNFCRLAKQKNLDLLINAFNDVSKKFPEYSLHIYGDGPEREHLEGKIIDDGLKGRVILYNYSANIYNEVIKASLFVSTSNYEGISNSMLEALALGIPTICTDCPAGGARETIKDGVNGILVPINDKEVLVDAMESILSNKALARQFADEGIKIREEISIDIIANQWLNYIEFLVE